MNKGTVSSSNGTFELVNLPDGRLKIQFSSLGYNNRIETVELNGSSLVMNMTLSQTVIEMEAIVVTGGYNSTQHENVVKFLTKVSGVDMISKGSGVSKPVIRGLSMNDILVLNNGARFENYQYSSHLIQNIVRTNVYRNKYIDHL
jgi:iron complex outermembrane recepter protein